jgi:hypothetical protein
MKYLNLVLTAEQAARIPIDAGIGTLAHTLTIEDTAESVQKYWDTLHALNMDPPIGNIIFTDATKPTLVLNENQLKDELSTDTAHGLLKFITSDYNLVISGVAAADAVTLLSNPLVDGVSVKDTAANISKYWTTFTSANVVKHVGGIVASDGGQINIPDYSVNSMGLIPSISGASSISIDITGGFSIDYCELGWNDS